MRAMTACKLGKVPEVFDKRTLADAPAASSVELFLARKFGRKTVVQESGFQITSYFWRDTIIVDDVQKMEGQADYESGF